MFKLKKVSLLALLVSANSFATYYAPIDVSKKYYKIFGEEDTITEDFATLKEGWFAYLDSNCESQDQDGVKINSVYSEMTEWESNSIVCSSGSSMLPDSNDLVSVDGSLKFLNDMFNIPSKRTFYNLSSVKGDFSIDAYGSAIELKDIVIDEQADLTFSFLSDINFSNFNSNIFYLNLVNFENLNLNNVTSWLANLNLRNYNAQNGPYADPDIQNPYNNIDLKLYENQTITIRNNIMGRAFYDFYSDYNLNLDFNEINVFEYAGINLTANSNNLNLINKNIESKGSFYYNLESKKDSNINLENINVNNPIYFTLDSDTLNLKNKNINSDTTLEYTINTLSDSSIDLENIYGNNSLNFKLTSKNLNLSSDNADANYTKFDLKAEDNLTASIINATSIYPYIINVDSSNSDLSVNNINAGVDFTATVKSLNSSIINIDNITSPEPGFNFYFDGNHQGTGSSIVNINNVSTLGSANFGTSGNSSSIETYIDQLNLSNIVFRNMLSIEDYSFVDKLNITDVSSDVENSTLQIANNAINEIVINTSTGDYLFDLVFNWVSMYIGSITINNTHPTEFINIPVVKNQFSVNNFKDSTGIKVKITDLAALSYSSNSVRTPETTTFCTNYGTRNFVLDSEDNVVDKNLLCGDNSHLQSS